MATAAPVRDLDFLTQQIKALEEEKQKLIQDQKREKIKEVRETCLKYGITAGDIFKERKPRTAPDTFERPTTMPRPNSKTPKYRDPVTGKEWAGVGRPAAFMPANKADWDQYLVR